MNEAHHEGTNTSKATKGDLDERTESIATGVVDSILKVYRALGPGLLESAYEACLIHDLKAVEAIHPIHEAQLLTYLRLSGKRLGFLVNFHAPTFKEALRRKIL